MAENDGENGGQRGPQMDIIPPGTYRINTALFKVTIQNAMLKLAGGDLTATVSFAGRKDEIGALGSTMQIFKDSMIDAERMRADQKESELRVRAERKADMERLAEGFRRVQPGVGSGHTQ